MTGRGPAPGSTQPVRGATSSATLPKPRADAPPSDTLYYDVAVVAPSGERLDVGRIEVPAFALSHAQHYWVALDVRGRLWILRKSPRCCARTTSARWNTSTAPRTSPT